MRGLVGLATLLLLVGCAGGGGQVVTAPQVVTDLPEAYPPLPSEPAECLECAPTVGDDADAGEASEAFAAECARVAALAEAGEHKPAIDALLALEEPAESCGEAVAAAVEESQRRLAEADDLLLDGQEARRAGDFAVARESFARARLVYPKYHWARKLEADLDADLQADFETARLKEKAVEQSSAGRVQEALQTLDQAMAHSAPGVETVELAQEATRLRTELGDSRLSAASRAERLGNLDRAVELTHLAIEADPETPVREAILDFARRLGLRLYSSGELLRARSLWQAAVGLDGDSSTLRQYLDEVDERLRSLDEIKDSRIP